MAKRAGFPVAMNLPQGAPAPKRSFQDHVLAAVGDGSLANTYSPLA
jgi:hypothetical protein